MLPQTSFSLRANGKLLLTGEYFVLDGALALALPLRLGQSIRVTRNYKPGLLRWRSYDHEMKSWFEGSFDLPGGKYRQSNDEETGRRLEEILQAVSDQHRDCWQFNTGLDVSCHLDFPRSWGLGSSSTLIYLIARWTGTDPFQLLEASFGGSGYDLACAGMRGPLLYQRLEGRPQYVRFPFNPPFRQHLFFVYLGKKQNSREGIARYREKVVAHPELIGKTSELTARIAGATDLDLFESFLREHEELVSETLELPRAKKLFFADHPGEVKSLGAWGGDFVLLTSRKSPETTRRELGERGFNIVFTFDELALI